MSSGRQRWLSAVLAVVLAVGVSLGANLPAQRRTWLHSHGALHPWYHLGIIGLLAWLAVGAARTRWLQVLLLAIIILLGGATEFVEYWYHAAALETNDMLLDAAGAAVGASVAVLMQRRIHRRSEGHWE